MVPGPVRSCPFGGPDVQSQSRLEHFFPELGQPTHISSQRIQRAVAGLLRTRSSPSGKGDAEAGKEDEGEEEEEERKSRASKRKAREAVRLVPERKGGSGKKKRRRSSAASREA